MHEAHAKVKAVIESCDKKEHIKAARRMLWLFEQKYFKPKKYNVLYFRELESLLFLKEDEFVWF